jgi:hypothetical protein
MLREVSGGAVHPFEMRWRPKSDALPLTRRDHQILTRLLADQPMADVRDVLETMRAVGNKGDFEQESLGRPLLQQWPFYETSGNCKNAS